jgi:hypothetical protein
MAFNINFSEIIGPYVGDMLPEYLDRVALRIYSSFGNIPASGFTLRQRP